ncbi:MAG: holo-ACP synthase [Candidatus Izemoplasmatales bacterium]
MILGIGVDICQNSRINLKVSERILNEDELVVFNDLKLETRKLEYLAGRFAVKEAIIKAFSQAKIDVYMREIVVLNDEINRPIMVKPIFDDLSIKISLSHEKEHSIGFAIVESIV